MQLKNSWLTYGSAFLVLLCVLPIAGLLYTAAGESASSFEHIKQIVLADYVVNTLHLMVLVGLLVSLIGIPLAWLVACCQFSGRRFFNWALILPLAMPGYLIAYTYTDLLDYAGPVQVSLRRWFGWNSPQDYWFFDIRSIGGAAVMLALVLFPYVYLMVKANFMAQNASLTAAARSLGYTPFKSFIKVSLPIARKAIAASVALVLMETLADFATVHYFAVNTLTTAVYDTWLGYYDLASAAKLSAFMIVGVLGLIALEHFTKKQNKISTDVKMSSTPLTYHLKGKYNVLAFGFCSVILLLGFVIPAITLLGYAIDYWQEVWTQEVFEYAYNSAYIAVCVAAISLIVSLILNVNLRWHSDTSNAKSKLSLGMLPVASMGYAVPGTVLAIAVIIPFTVFEHFVNEQFETLGWNMPGLFLTGTVIAIITAHIVRFVAIANNGVKASFGQINRHYDAAALSLGHSPMKQFFSLHWPLIKRSAFVAALLIFVESMKELPAALLLRPFDFQTLPTFVFQYASDEQLEQAALGAILIVVVGLLPLLYINRSINKTVK